MLTNFQQLISLTCSTFPTSITTAKAINNNDQSCISSSIPSLSSRISGFPVNTYKGKIHLMKITMQYKTDNYIGKKNKAFLLFLCIRSQQFLFAYIQFLNFRKNFSQLLLTYPK